MTLSLQTVEFQSVDAQRGTLTVPMNRAAGRGRVELVFVRLPSTSPQAGPPIVFLCGGPGLSGIRFARGRLFPMFDALRAAGDVILLDQRGSGESTPSLACAEPLALAFDRAWTKDEVLRAVAEAARACAARLAGAGVDVSAFNSNESADDVADLARALGAGRVSLLGWSYGTHLSFAVMRRHPELVGRAVLAGPEGPNHTYKLPSRIQRQLETVAARARTGDPPTPDLLATMRAVWEAAEREPALVQLPDANGDTHTAKVGRFDLEYMTAEGIADVRMLARLPAWYARMAKGDFSDFAHDALVRSYFEECRNGQLRSLVPACMDCASGASAERRRRIEEEARTALLGRTIDFPFPEICDAVGNPDAGDAFRAPISSNAEVLFITGTLDARTSADNVADLAPGFPRHRHLVIDGAGHADLLTPPAVQGEIVRFFTSGEIVSDRARVDPAL